MIGLILDLVVGYSASYVSGYLARRVGLSFARWFFGASLLPWIVLPVVIWKNLRDTEYGRGHALVLQVTLAVAATGWFALSALSVLTLNA